MSTDRDYAWSKTELRGGGRPPHSHSSAVPRAPRDALNDMLSLRIYILRLGFSFFRGLVTPAEGRREYIHLGLTTAYLLPTPPTGVTRPLRLRTEKAMWAAHMSYIPHPCGKGAVIFSAILSVARVPREAAWRYL